MAVQQQAAQPPKSLQPPKPTNVLDCLEWAVAVANALLQCVKEMPKGQKARVDPRVLLTIRLLLTDDNPACNIDETGCENEEPGWASLEDVRKGLERLIVYLNAVVAAYERRA